MGCGDHDSGDLPHNVKGDFTRVASFHDEIQKRNHEQDLFFGVYNFVRRHETLGTTPAVVDCRISYLPGVADFQGVGGSGHAKRTCRKVSWLVSRFGTV
jgi:hypothetical protein